MVTDFREATFWLLTLQSQYLVLRGQSMVRHGPGWEDDHSKRELTDYTPHKTEGVPLETAQKEVCEGALGHQQAWMHEWLCK